MQRSSEILLQMFSAREGFQKPTTCAQRNYIVPRNFVEFDTHYVPKQVEVLTKA
jgi:hypothetical protein